MKKVFIAMLLVLALIAPMFAQGGEETKKATFDKDAPVKIVFWTHEDTSRNVLENQYLEEFKASDILCRRKRTDSLEPAD